MSENLLKCKFLCEIYFWGSFNQFFVRIIYFYRFQSIFEFQILVVKKRTKQNTTKNIITSMQLLIIALQSELLRLVINKVTKYFLKLK